MEDKNLDQEATLVDEKIKLKQFNVDHQDHTPSGQNGHHVLSAINLGRSQLLLFEIVVILVLKMLSSKKRLALHLDVHSGQTGVHGVHVQPRVVWVSSVEFEIAKVKMNFAHL